MLYPPRVETLAQHLSRTLQGRRALRRRELLGVLLECKAASGAFDLELLHHWLDSGLARRDDRALFGLDDRGIGYAPEATDALEFSRFHPRRPAP